MPNYQLTSIGVRNSQRFEWVTNKRATPRCFSWRPTKPVFFQKTRHRYKATRRLVAICYQPRKKILFGADSDSLAWVSRETQHFSRVNDLPSRRRRAATAIVAGALRCKEANSFSRPLDRITLSAPFPLEYLISGYDNILFFRCKECR
jgi:hypothetical protein